MRGNNPILLGANKVCQFGSALELVGKETKLLGNRALVVAGETSWIKFGTKISKLFEREGVSFEWHCFTGYCSENNTDSIAKKAKGMNADVVIAMGGGRSIDAGKWAANKAGVKCMTIPTSAATCAAYVSLCVLYDDTGSTIKTIFCENDVNTMLVDTDIIVNDCPARMFSSGIADALAKYPEMDFSMKFATNWEKSVLPSMGVMLSKFNADKYFEDGLVALEDIRNEKTTEKVEDILATNIILTGMISCLASGGKQIAIAHSIYDCVCTHFKPQRANFLHGEIVSCGLSVQMGINGYSEVEIEKTVQFLHDLGTPTKLSDLGIDPNEKNLTTFFNYIVTMMDINSKDLQSTIWANLERIAF